MRLIPLSSIWHEFILGGNQKSYKPTTTITGLYTFHVKCFSEGQENTLTEMPRVYPNWKIIAHTYFKIQHEQVKNLEHFQPQ